MHFSSRPRLIQPLARRSPWLAIALVAAVACQGTPEEPLAANECDGSFVGRLHGGIEAELNWSADALQCSGMPRPEDEGARLRFAGMVGRDGAVRHLLFILALPTLERGVSADELPATITVIEEDAGRFFSNGDNPVCWADIDRQDLVRDPHDYRVSGIAYCLTPLAELNGSANVSFTDLEFAGRLSWAQPE